MLNEVKTGIGSQGDTSRANSGSSGLGHGGQGSTSEELRTGYTALEGLAVFASKTGVRVVFKFGPQNLGRYRCYTWHYWRACIEAKQLHEGTMVVRYMEDLLRSFCF